jgi:hypothetical protein
MQIDIAEIRSWITVMLAVTGGFIGIRQYKASQKQRRLENSFRMIDLFVRSVKEGDIDEWRGIFHGASEPSGAKPGYFNHVSDDVVYELSFSDLFTEGPPDNGAIERMAEVFDLIGYSVKEQAIDLRVIYFELGQIMDTVHSWLATIDSQWENKSFLEAYYPHYNYLYTKLKVNEKQWPRKTYDHIG